MEKQELIKSLIAEDKKKKKVTCTADKIKARELPAHPGRGIGRGRGRRTTCGAPSCKVKTKG